MANTKSAKKNIRKTLKNTEHNRGIISRIRTLNKKVAAASASGDAAKTKEAASEYISALDKASKNGLVHPNKVARHKSACSKHLAK